MKSVRIFLSFLLPLLAAVSFPYTHCLKKSYVRVSSQRLVELLRMILFLSFKFPFSISHCCNNLEWSPLTDQATKYVRPVLFHSLPTKTNLVAGRELCFSYLHQNKDYKTNHYLSGCNLEKKMLLICRFHFIPLLAREL